jgi:riboflavin synthase
VFSGIIEAQGRVAELRPIESGAVLALDDGFDPASLAIGESICTNGVCLTVRSITERGFVADLSAETLARTTLGALRSGDRVNLERSLRVGDRISGHFVFGHVDGVGEISEFAPEGEGFRLRVAAPVALAPYLVDKGSIAVDGISLTMCGAAAVGSFEVALIPHTVDVTNLRRRKVGDRVNLEADMLARYARRAVETLPTSR